MNAEKEGRYRHHMVRCLCVMMYFMLVLNKMGVSIDFFDKAEWGKSPVSGAVSNEKEGENEQPKGKIALTFDDGPNKKYTKKLLDGLKKRNVKATFFVIGRCVEEYPEVAKRIAREGHLIGNHTYSHIAMNHTSEQEVKQELEKASNVIHEVTGKYPQYMRPPYGACSRQMEDSLDMILVRWTIDPLDWNHESTDEIVNKVVTKAGEDDIILLHDCYKESVDAALRIVDILQEKGYEFVTVDELYLN